MRNYLLLTPGPLSTTETVRQAMLQDWCTWDKDYNEGVVMPIPKHLLRLAEVEDSNYTSVLLQGSGTFSVEAVLSSVVRPTDKLLVIANGAYGERIGEIAAYHKLDCLIYRLTETEVVTPEMVSQLIESNPDITHFAMVHCETTTGILNPLPEISEVFKRYPITFILDAMSSFGGIPIPMEELGIDYLISSANKCIQGVPGFGFVIAKQDKLASCKGVARSLSLDLYAQWEAMEKGNGKWRFTSPTHVVHAFGQALKELDQEGGVEARNDRYVENNKNLIQGMTKLGFQPLLPENIQSPIISSFLYPSASFDFTQFYESLKSKGYVIYPGKISNAATFRIGNIGDVYPVDIHGLLQAMKETVEELGIVFE